MAEEQRVQKAIIRVLTGRGAHVINYTPGKFGVAGTPDLLVCYKGRFIGLEVKGPTGVLSAKQKSQIGKILDAGGRASVVRNVTGVLDILDSIDREAVEHEWI